jgi:uncharacterized pyridoxamine 5'-phosphate oxidase family protein
MVKWFNKLEISMLLEAKSVQEVCDFLKKCKSYYIATVDGDQPRVRPFSTVHIFDNKLYIQTGKSKDVSKQIRKNPKVEICAMAEGQWIRIQATMVEDEGVEANASMLDAYPNLKKRYSVNDGNCQVLYLKNATATISSFTDPPKVIKF